MSKEMNFFLYLIENYAHYKNTTSDVIIKKLNELNIFDYVFNNYEFYHIEALEQVYEDIDNKIKEYK